MQVWWVFLLMGYIIDEQFVSAARPVTNEDIRDAMLSVVHMIRSTEDKLERHEFRERALGDQIKKSLSIIDKRQRLLEPVKGTIGRLDERLANVETILIQKDERERIQMQKIYDMVEQIHQSLPQLFEVLKNDITSSFPKDQAPSDGPSRNDLDKLQKEIESKIENSSKSAVQNIQQQIRQVNQDNNKLKEHATENLENVKKHINSSQQVLQKYENKLAEYNKVKGSSEENKQTTKILQALEAQKSSVDSILKDVKQVSSKITKIPEENLLLAVKNETLRSLQQVKEANHVILDNKFKEVQGINQQLHHSIVNLDEDNKNLAEDIKHLKKQIDKIVGDPKVTQLITKLNEGTSKIDNLQSTIADNNKNIEGMIQNQKTNTQQLFSDIKSVADKLSKIPKTADVDQIRKEVIQSLDLIGTQITKMEEKTNGLNQLITKTNNVEVLSKNYDKLNTNLQNFTHFYFIDFELQKNNVQQVLLDLKGVSNRLSKLPEPQELQQLKKGLEELKYEMLQQTGQSASLLDSKLKELHNKSDNNTMELHKSMLRITEMTDNLNANLAESFEKLRNEVQDIGKLESVMVQTADGIIDTKRRVEYGVHQILLEVGNLVKQYSKDVNSTLNDRFDVIESTILEPENGALANLTNKIAGEIDQVWKQISIMHKQMTASTEALGKLQEQADGYVNGSLTTMDNMGNKVGKITERMIEIDENLNYLLGRLSLVTQEFNQIKTGLGKALDEIKSNLHTVQNKMEEPGPGPHNIASEEVNNNVRQ